MKYDALTDTTDDGQISRCLDRCGAMDAAGRAANNIYMETNNEMILGGRYFRVCIKGNMMECLEGIEPQDMTMQKNICE